MKNKSDIFNNIDSIIFDLDGTLWDSTKEVLISWNNVLKTFDEVEAPFTQKAIEGYMGMPTNKIFESFFHYLKADKRKAIQDACSSNEIEYLKEHGGRLYPNLESVLLALSNKYKLFIVSNCQHEYIDTFLEFYGFEKYFIDYEYQERTNKSKGENIRLVIERNNLKSSIYIGDTDGDSEAARYAGIPFIYASYGFGDTKDYDYVIEKVEELIE